MLTKQRRNIINFMVACVNEFATKYGLSTTEAFAYLHQYKGIAFIKDHYEVQHWKFSRDSGPLKELKGWNNGRN